MDIRGAIINDIKEKVGNLKYKGESVKINNVYPDILEAALGDFDDGYELNGYDCDYWANVQDRKYSICGCMRYGYATITLEVGDVKKKDDGEEKEREEDNPYTRTTFQPDWLNVAFDNIPPVIPNVSDEKLDELLEDGVLRAFYITFPADFTSKTPYVIIYAKDEMGARKRAFSIWGRRWASIYNVTEWTGIIEKYGKQFTKSFYISEKRLVLSWR